MTRVILTEQEMRFAADTGIMRRIVSMRQGLKDSAGYSGRAGGVWQMDVLGAMGELAVAKALGAYWTPGINTFKLPDVMDLHVRATEHKAGRLIVRPNDRPGWYVLVVIDAPAFDVIGFCGLEFARQDQFRAVPEPGRPPCWAVPQSHLAPIEWLNNQRPEPYETQVPVSPLRKTAPVPAG